MRYNKTFKAKEEKIKDTREVAVGTKKLKAKQSSESKCIPLTSSSREQMVERARLHEKSLPFL
jgi:hypothetical protein